MSIDVAYSGLYYPHTTFEDVSVLKTSLLLWDELQFIVPSPEFELRSGKNDRLIDEAYELICKPLVPNDSEKKQVHEQVVELLTDPNSQHFLQQMVDRTGDQSEIYPQKFLGETWNELAGLGLAIGDGSKGFFQDYLLDNKLALLLMHYLAQACAGATRRLITDRVLAYNSLNHALAASTTESKAPTDVERVVTRSIRIVDPTQISLEKLVALRRAEHGTNGHSLRKMRHNYLAMIDRFAREVNQADNVDIEEIERRQEQEMKDNLAELRDALKASATDVLHEKEIFIAMVAAAGMAVAPLAVPAGITSIIVLNKTRLKYKEARRKAMADHAMSWLLQATQHGRITTF